MPALPTVSQPAALLATIMTVDEATWILTWTDEPDLLAETGQPGPTFTETQIAAARQVGRECMLGRALQRAA